MRKWEKFLLKNSCEWGQKLYSIVEWRKFTFSAFRRACSSSRAACFSLSSTLVKDIPVLAREETALERVLALNLRTDKDHNSNVPKSHSNKYIYITLELWFFPPFCRVTNWNSHWVKWSFYHLINTKCTVFWRCKIHFIVTQTIIRK